MKTKVLGLMAIVLVVAFGTAYGWPWSAEAKTAHEIKQDARKASVQPVFHIPILKVTFTAPLLEEEEKECLSKEEVEKLFNERLVSALGEDGLIKGEIDLAISKDKTEREADRYKSTLTDIDEYGYKSPTRKFIPLGGLAPKWAKFPERVIVVSEIKEEEISIWEKEYEKDILTISETADVSPTAAKSIVTNLKNAGYKILREEEEQVESAKLLWFNNGWDDKYPMTLDWLVEVEGTEQNIIIGYQIGGILEVRTIPEDARVHVKAGYFDLMDVHKPKPGDVVRLENSEKSLERQLKRLKEEKEKIEEEYAEYKKEAEKEEEEKRDISTVTWYDVIMGRVKIEQFWAVSAASGIFLGNMDAREEFSGFQGYLDIHNVSGERKAAVLTNAHVANAAIGYEVYVTEDKEVMWVVYPAYCSMRFTKDSDSVGSPAQLLAVDFKPVLSWDVDTAIMVTTEVPEYEDFKASLGDSDAVKEGDPVISVGNPGMMQKFLTEGVVSRVDYSLLNSLTMGWWIHQIPSLTTYNWIKNSSMWYDAPIGIGGTSGSGVWAVEGPEAGKVIALHNMGLAQPLAVTGTQSDPKEFDPKAIESEDEKILLKSYLRDKRDVIFADYPYEKAEFGYDVERFAEEQNGFVEAMKSHGLWIDIAGMNGAVPINKVKRFLQERGLSPKDFGWEGVDESYWVK